MLPPEIARYYWAESKAGVSKSRTPRVRVRYAFWTPNPRQVTWVILVDIDHDDALLRALWVLLPRPSWVVHNLTNGHAQAAWIIHPVSHGPTSRAHPQQFLRAVTHSLRLAVGGDPAFTGRRCRNPWFESDEVEVFWGPTEPRHLGELKADLVAAGLWVGRPLTPTQDGGTGEGDALTAPALDAGPIVMGRRNVAVFDVCRFAAYEGRDFAEVARDTNRVLCDPPMGEREVERIIESVSGWTGRNPDGTKAEASERTHSGGPSDYVLAQKRRGRAGGMARSDAQTAQRRANQQKATERATLRRQAKAEGRAAEILRYAREGMSRSQIMAETGASESTVKRVLREARKRA